MPIALEDDDDACQLSDNEEDAGDNDESSDFFNDDDDDDESYESEEDDGSGRTLLFLCEEGQLDLALERVREWDGRFSPPGTTATGGAASAGASATIQRELFRRNPSTGNYCLHEILAGGTSGKSAPELVERLVRRYTSSGATPSAMADYRSVFLAQPAGSNGRTVLHWCAWSKTTPKLTRMVLGACPEAMCLRDNKSHSSRTPLEIAERYWPDDEITAILRSSLRTYLPHRVRICVRLCVGRFFFPSHRGKAEKADLLTQRAAASNSKEDAAASSQTTYSRVQRAFKPFDKNDRRIAGLAPRPWFVASVLGYALQREMKGLALRILSFVGYGAKLPKGNSKKKNKRRSRPATINEGNEINDERGNCNKETTSKSRKKRKTRLAAVRKGA